MKDSHDISNKKYTLMIVPHSGDNVKRFRLPKVAVSLTCGVLLLTLSYTGLITYRYHNQRSDFQKRYEHLNMLFTAKLDELNSLSLITENQRLEIEQLQGTAQEVKKKLETISEMSYEIRNKYGLSIDTNLTVSDADVVTSNRGLVKGMSSDSFSSEDIEGDIALLASFGQDIVYSNDEDDIIALLNELSSVIDNQTNDLESLVDEVDSRIRYIEHRPARYPVSGRITSGFGYRLAPYGSRGYELHTGVDIGAPSGTPIYAAGAGTVIFSAFQGSYGRLIIIDHGYGIKTLYAHNSANLVNVGDKVVRGTLIGRVGSTGVSTGPHVHFEIREHDVPVDPRAFLERNF